MAVPKLNRILPDEAQSHRLRYGMLHFIHPTNYICYRIKMKFILRIFHKIITHLIFSSLSATLTKKTETR